MVFFLLVILDIAVLDDNIFYADSLSPPQVHCNAFLDLIDRAESKASQTGKWFFMMGRRSHLWLQPFALNSSRGCVGNCGVASGSGSLGFCRFQKKRFSARLYNGIQIWRICTSTLRGNERINSFILSETDTIVVEINKIWGLRPMLCANPSSFDLDTTQWPQTCCERFGSWMVKDRKVPNWNSIVQKK